MFSETVDRVASTEIRCLAIFTNKRKFRSLLWLLAYVAQAVRYPQISFTLNLNKVPVDIICWFSVIIELTSEWLTSFFFFKYLFFDNHQLDKQQKFEDDIIKVVKILNTKVRLATRLK